MSSVAPAPALAWSEEPASVVDEVLAIDQSGLPMATVDVGTNIDSENATLTIFATSTDPTSAAFEVLIRESWLRSLVKEPAFLNTTVSTTTHADTTWFSVKVDAPAKGLSLVVKEFAPELGRSWYSRGSLNSILLERPMLISIAELPHVDIEKVTLSNSNGTWNEERPAPVVRLGILFSDADTSGQKVVINRS